MKKVTYFGGALGLFALPFVCSLNVFAEDIIDVVNITVPASCTLSGTNLTHTATMQVNQYKTDIGAANIKATCNDSAGFSIYAIGYSGEQYGNNKMLHSSLGDSVAINTGKYVSGTTTESVWSVKLTPVSGAYAPTIRDDETYDYTDYEVIPESYTKVVSSNTATDAGSGATGSNFTVDYAVFASSHQAAGTYTGKVKFTLVHPVSEPAPVAPLAESACPASSICYAPNANDIIGSMDSISNTKISSSPMAGVQSVSTNGTATLIAPNYSRTDYGFAGWSTDFAATTSSTIYGPNQVLITKTDGTGDVNVSSQGLILYPVWVQYEDYIQEWDGCGDLTQATYSNSTINATLNSVTALKDRRDGNVYAVARLTDGNCWMIENLRLGNNVSAADMAAWSEGLGGNFTVLAESENSHFANDSTANSLYSGTYVTIPRWNGNNTDRTLDPSYNSSGTYSSWYSYGHYYNFPAMKATTLSFNGAAASNAAGTSICPKGWTLPAGTTAGEPYLLSQSMSGNTSQQGAREFLRFPNNFVLSGWINGASQARESLNGYYMTKTTTNNSSSAYVYNVSTSSLTIGGSSSDNYQGRPVRCLIHQSE